MTRDEMYIGQPVENLGETAVVVGFHHVTGDPILRDLDNRYRWVADAANCTPWAYAPEKTTPMPLTIGERRRYNGR